MKLLVATWRKRWANSSESVTASRNLDSSVSDVTMDASGSRSNSLEAVSMKLSSDIDTVTFARTSSDKAAAYALLRASFTRLPNGKWKIAFLLPVWSTYPSISSRELVGTFPTALCSRK